MSKKQLILIRHATRDVSDRAADNGLNAAGKKQADAVARDLLPQLKSGSRIRLASSPRARCVETLEPLATSASATLEIDPLLEERTADEDARQFAKRIKAFFEQWKADSHDITLACSHGDWLPWLMELATGHTMDFKKAEWVCLELDGDGRVTVVDRSAKH